MAPDESWSALASLNADAARAQMTRRFHDVARLPEDERMAQLRSMIEAEYDLDEPRLLAFTAVRLRSWIELEPEAAKAIAEGYRVVFDGVSGEMAMRRTSVVQTVAREMTADQVVALQAIIPWMVSQIPSARRPAAAPSASPEPQRESKPFWKFWQRG